MQDIYLGFYLIYSFHLQRSVVLAAAFYSFTQSILSTFQSILFFPLRLRSQHVSVMPSVRVPKTERIRHPQQCKSIKGFIASSSHIQHSGVEQEPRAQIYSSIYKFRTKTGSWQRLIGCRGFLVFTDWPVIIPLIGQSYHLSNWPELSSPEAPEAWLRDYIWPSAPLWACHGSGEVVTGWS